MTRIVLSRFHRDPGVVRNHVRLFRALNPGVSVFGLFGGPRRFFPLVSRLYQPCFDDVYFLRAKPSLWKWAHGDLAVCEWFRNTGQHVDFDSVVLLEWDVLFLDSIDHVYGHVGPDELALTGPRLLGEVASSWTWLEEDAYRREVEELRRHVSRTLGCDAEPIASIMPGACLPRGFLEQYSSLQPPELAHDEVRLGLFSQALGYRPVDTGLYRGWDDPADLALFNAEEQEVRRDAIGHELANPAGRRAFHPVRYVAGPTLLRPLLRSWGGRERPQLGTLWESLIEGGWSMAATAVRIPGSVKRTLVARLRGPTQASDTGSGTVLADGQRR